MKHFVIIVILATIFFTQNCVAQNVGIGTITPKARLHVTDSSVLFSATDDIPTVIGDPPISDAGRRMMWYADKAAFRVGYVSGTQWNKSNIGDYSFAAGIGTIASGNYSNAMGYFTNATGPTSTTFGYTTEATGASSTALGLSTRAFGFASTAMGYGSLAAGNLSFALGELVIANSYNSTSLGSYNNPVVTTPTSTWVPTEPLLIVGNGSAGQASNALVILKNGYTGIGNNAPNAPLAFPPALGKKITLYPGATGDVGMAVRGNLFQIYSDNPSADIAFGYDVAGTMTERMRIKGNGNVGIGNNSANAPLAFANATGRKISLYDGGLNNYYGFGVESGQLQIYTDASLGKISFGYYNAGTFSERMYLSNSTGILTVNGTNYPSDARYKKEISTLQNALQKIIAIRGVEYFMRTDEFPEKHFDTKLQVGLIAQDVEKVLPQAVQTDNEGYKSVDYAKMVPLLVEGIKEQQKKIDELKALVQKLINK